MRIAYLTTCSPVPPVSGHSLRVHANWRAFSELAQVRTFAFDSRPLPAERTELRHLGITCLAARREARAALLARHVRSFLRGRSMLYAKACSPARTRRLAGELRAWGADLLVIGDTWLADLLPELRGAARRIVVDTHNVESRLYTRIVAEQPWPRRLKYILFRENVRRIERHLAEADAVWAVSEADAEVYRSGQGLGHVAVLPNALDTDAYAPAGTRPEPDTIVFTGSYGYWPNEAAALHLIGLSGRLAAQGFTHRMLLVGRDPSPCMFESAKAVPSVTVTGPVADVRSFIARAALVAAPLTSGSGTKYKLLEALAMGRPVVTTPVGAEGLDLRDGVNAVVANDLAGFDEAVAAALREPARTESMAGAGRAWVVRTHSLAALGRALRGALDELGLSRAAPEQAA
jgi:glycosyltransferase involved in cell wall biosynthesis